MQGKKTCKNVTRVTCLFGFRSKESKTNV